MIQTTTVESFLKKTTQEVKLYLIAQKNNVAPLIQNLEDQTKPYMKNLKEIPENLLCKSEQTLNNYIDSLPLDEKKMVFSQEQDFGSRVYILLQKLNYILNQRVANTVNHLSQLKSNVDQFQQDLQLLNFLEVLGYFFELQYQQILNQLLVQKDESVLIYQKSKHFFQDLLVQSAQYTKDVYNLAQSYQTQQFQSLSSQACNLYSLMTKENIQSYLNLQNKNAQALTQLFYSQSLYRMNNLMKTLQQQPRVLQSYMTKTNLLNGYCYVLTQTQLNLSKALSYSSVKFGQIQVYANQFQSKVTLTINASKEFLNNFVQNLPANLTAQKDAAMNFYQNSVQIQMNAQFFQDNYQKILITLQQACENQRLQIISQTDKVQNISQQLYLRIKSNYQQLKNEVQQRKLKQQ